MSDRTAALAEALLPAIMKRWMGDMPPFTANEARAREEAAHAEAESSAAAILAALDAAGWTLTEKRESVRDTLERMGLPQREGRIPTDIVHPSPFEDDYPYDEIARYRRIEEAHLGFCRLIVSYADLTHRVVQDAQGDPMDIAREWAGVVAMARAALEEGYTIEQQFTATDAFPGVEKKP